MNRPAVVVFGWAAANALLTVVLVIFSYQNPFPLIVYMCAVLLIGGFGTAVLVAARHEAADWYPTAVRSASSAFLAIGITLIGLGFVYGLWLMLVALYPLLLAGILLGRERLSSAVIPTGWRLPLDPTTGRAPPRVVPADLSATPPSAMPPAEPRSRPGASRSSRAVAAAAAGLGLVAQAFRVLRRRR